MINPIEKGIMRKKLGNNPYHTHVRHTCPNRHKTLKRRNDKKYICQKCLEISFNEKNPKPENQEFVRLIDFEKLIPKNKKPLPLKEADKLI